MFTATCELDEKAQLAMTCTNGGEGRTVREAEQCQLVQSMTPVFARYLEISTMGRDVYSEDFDRRETEAWIVTIKIGIYPLYPRPVYSPSLLSLLRPSRVRLLFPQL